MRRHGFAPSLLLAGSLLLVFSQGLAAQVPARIDNNPANTPLALRPRSYCAMPPCAAAPAAPPRRCCVLGLLKTCKNRLALRGVLRRDLCSCDGGVCDGGCRAGCDGQGAGGCDCEDAGPDGCANCHRHDRAGQGNSIYDGPAGEALDEGAGW